MNERPPIRVKLAIAAVLAVTVSAVLLTAFRWIDPTSNVGIAIGCALIILMPAASPPLERLVLRRRRAPR